MINWKAFSSQMFTIGTLPCTVLCAVVGILFAVLFLTIGLGKTLLIGVFCLIGCFIGGVKDKVGFVSRIAALIRRKNNEGD